MTNTTLSLEEKGQLKHVTDQFLEARKNLQDALARFEKKDLIDIAVELKLLPEEMVAELKAEEDNYEEDEELDPPAWCPQCGDAMDYCTHEGEGYDQIKHMPFDERKIYYCFLCKKFFKFVETKPLEKR